MGTATRRRGEPERAGLLSGAGTTLATMPRPGHARRGQGQNL